MLTTAAIVARPPKTRAAITNGKLAGLDGRSAAARRYRDLTAAYAADLGGADNLSETQRTLIAQVAALQVAMQLAKISYCGYHRMLSDTCTAVTSYTS